MNVATSWSRTPRRARTLLLSASCLLLAPLAAEARVTILESNEDHVVFEVVPEPAKMVSVQASGLSYVRLQIPGFGQTEELGLPEVPVGSVRVAIPPYATPRLRVLEEQWSARRAGAVVPVGQRVGVREPFGANRVIEREPVEGSAYRSTSVYPESAFSLSGIAGLRNLRTVSVSYFGAKAELSARAHVLLERAVLEVTFTRDERAERPRGTRPAPSDELWERTVRGSVLNAERAAVWGLAGPGDGTIVGDSPWGAGDQWKILVAETGLAQLSFATLSTAGFPGGISVDDLVLEQRTFKLGSVDSAAVSAANLFAPIPVPIRVVDVGVDGQFGPGDFLWFYGRSFRDQWMTSGRENEDLFSHDNYFWLKINPAGGARMATVRPGGSLSGTATDSLATTASTAFLEKDTQYYERPPDFAAGLRAFESEFYFRNNAQSPTTEGDNIVGWLLKSDGQPYDTFDVADPAPGTTATLVLRVLGGGSGAVSADRYYTTRFESTLNDVLPPLAQKTFYNSDLFVGAAVPPANVLHSFPVPAGVLVPGPNRLSFRGWSYIGNSTLSPFTVTRFFFDWFQVNYRRLLLARNERLALTTAGGAAATLLVRVSGFTGADLRLFDVTNPAVPAEVGVAPAQIVPDGGGFALRFDHDNAVAPGNYVAIRASQIPSVPNTNVTRVSAPTLLAGGTGARYIALAHDSLLSGAQELAALRSARMSAITAPLSEVWDVFNNGMRDPRAMKAYLAYAFHRWSEPPAFLCLVGDASEDHQDLLSESEPDLVPSHSLYASYDGAPEETDQYFAELTLGAPADPDGFDDVPDLYVGRLAVNTPEELAWNVQRIREYEDPASDDHAWRRRVVLVSDDAFSGDLGGGFGQDGYRFQGNEITFREASDDYADSLAALPFDDMVVDKLYVGSFTMPCPDSCYDNNDDRCDIGLGRDCGIFYACRDSTDWVAEYTCMRQAARAAVLPELRDKLSAGALIWNFEGHGNRFFLTHEEIFRDDPIGGAADVSTLTNAGQPFLFLGFACHLAEFDNADERIREDSIAEKLLNERPLGLDRPGGAIGSFASSGFEFLGPNLDFNADVFEAFFHPERAMQTGTLPDVPGEGAVYAWTLGEATTRARLLYLNRFAIGAADSRQAAQRFVLLGDPAVTPDVGGPQIRVTVNGASVASGEFLDAASGGLATIVATVENGRGIGVLRVVDSVRGEIPVTEAQVAVNDSTTDGVARSKTLTYAHTLRADSYDLVVEASNERAAVSRFVLSVRSDLSVLDVTPYPNPFGEELALYYRLTKRADEVRVRVFTVAGRKVYESEDAPSGADVNVFNWDGRDSGGNVVANGTYLVHLRASGPEGDSEATSRIVKIR